MAKMSDSSETSGASNSAQAAPTAPSGTDEGPTEKQQMVEKLFRHTNQFLEQNKRDPLLVVEALAAILVRYAALFGPVEQMRDRLVLLEGLIGQECAQIQAIAKTQEASKQR